MTPFFQRNFFLCPKCGKDLIEYESFFLCENFHKVERDIHKNLLFPTKETVFWSKKNCAAVSSLLSCNLFYFLYDTVLETVREHGKDAETIFFDAFLGETLRGKNEEGAALSAVSLCRSKNRLKTFFSDEELLFFLGSFKNIKEEAFDVVVSFGEHPAECRRILKKGGLFISAVPGEAFGRELFCLGFPKARDFREMIPDSLRFKKVFRFSKRFYLKQEDLAPFVLHTSLAPFEETPSALTGFSDGFVTLEFVISVLKKERIYL